MLWQCSAAASKGQPCQAATGSGTTSGPATPTLAQHGAQSCDKDRASACYSGLICGCVHRHVQAEIARIKADAAAEVAAAQGRAAASAAAGDTSAGDASTADVAGQKAQLERTVAELTATLSARQKEFDARLRCAGQAASRIVQ